MSKPSPQNNFLTERGGREKKETKREIPNTRGERNTVTEKDGEREKVTHTLKE
jgi:hypothetical protein